MCYNKPKYEVRIIYFVKPPVDVPPSPLYNSSSDASQEAVLIYRRFRVWQGKISRKHV